MSRKTSLIVAGLALFLIFADNLSLAGQSVITVYPDKEIAKVNNMVFGNNLQGYDLCEMPNIKCNPSNSNRLSDYGAGIWDPGTGEPVEEITLLAKNIGMSAIRFPGGTGSDHYDWKKSIGKGRKQFLFGLDEFMKTVKEIGGEAVIVVSYFTGNEQDASDLVEYLNAPLDGKHIWAEKRAANGHPEPYGVRFFEFGNEVMNGDRRKIKKVYPGEYAERYPRYQKAMKNIDPDIKLGAVLADETDWNNKVIKAIGPDADFFIMHIYPPFLKNRHNRHKDRRKYETMDPEDLFEIALGSVIFDTEFFFSDTLQLIKERTERTDALFAITESNGSFVQKKPVPYRHTMGNALLNAELLRIYMRPENNILMVNHFNFLNVYFSMLKTKTNFSDAKKQFWGKPLLDIKRPNYLLYELYNKHFGDVLVENEVLTDTYDIEDIQLYLRDSDKKIQRLNGGVTIKDNLLENNWKEKHVSGVKIENSDDLLSLEFDNIRVNYFHFKQVVKIEPNTYYRLSGYIKTNGLDHKEGISLQIRDSRIWSKGWSWIFKNALASAQTNGVLGDNNWEYVDVLYKTLDNAEFVEIGPRIRSKESPLTGKVFIRDMKLEKFIPPIIRIPSLSVNTSVSSDRSKIYLMVVNKKSDNAIVSLVKLRLDPEHPDIGALPEKGPLRAEAWTLNGPSITATNEIKKDNVKVTYREIDIENNSFNFSFEPHSVTAIEITRRRSNHKN